jgi:glycosyltransferase involved in cell wall biosynthesis
MSIPDPAVSVVVPVYNGERFLRESLDSILDQTYRDIEVLLMDDASTDGAPSIMREYAEADERVQIHRAPKNRGIFANINAGIALARGELVAIHHSDDLYHPKILEQELAFLRDHPDVGVVFCADIFIDEDGREFGRLTLPAEIRANRVLDYEAVLNGFLRYMNSFIRGGSGLFRKAVLEEVGPFDDGYLLRADLEMWLRLARCAPVAVLDEHLVRYRWGHDNSSLRYEHLRTEPEISFTIIDRALAEGGRRVAVPDALAAYDGHRAEDLMVVAVNRYIVGNRRAVRDALRQVRASWILGTSRVERGRLLALYVLLHVLARIPRLAPVAAVFHSRWHGRGLERKRRARASRSGERVLQGAVLG